MDQYHFDAEGYREIGRRYARKMLSLVYNSNDNNNNNDNSSNNNNDTDVVAAINVGSFQGDTYKGVYYEPDNSYSGGTTHSTSDSISGASDSSVYQTERYGNYTYEIPMNNGSYSVDLGFVELYWTQAGSRSFSVSVEGTPLLNNFDIYRQVGHDVVYDPGPVDVYVNDGSLTIQVSTSVDNGTLSRILVRSKDLGG
jgi:hypothetical protein